MSKKQPTKAEVKEMIDNDEAVVHEVPPYTKINLAISSEGFQLELEENTPFSQAHKNYNKLLKNIINKHLVGKAKKEEKDRDNAHKNVDVA